MRTFVFILAVIPLLSHAQKDSSCNLNSMHLELGGKYPWVGNVSYERRLDEVFAVGAAIGFTEYGSSENIDYAHGQSWETTKVPWLFLSLRCKSL